MMWVALFGLACGIFLVGYSGYLYYKGEYAASDRKLIIAMLIFAAVGRLGEKA